MSGRLKETPITCRTIETEDRGSREILVTENETETSPWIGEAKQTHGTIQEADTDTTHKLPETQTCLRAIDKTIAMIHARDKDKDTILESTGRNNNIE